MRPGPRGPKLKEMLLVSHRQTLRTTIALKEATVIRTEKSA